MCRWGKKAVISKQESFQRPWVILILSFHNLTKKFYFVSEAPKFIFFIFLRGYFSNLHIQTVKHSWQNGWWTIHIWYDDSVFRKCILFPNIFSDFSGFSTNLHISFQDGWFTSHIWYDDFLFRKFIWFPDSFLDFSRFYKNLHISTLVSYFFTELMIYISKMMWWFYIMDFSIFQIF